MKNIVFFLRHVITPLVLCFFLILGMTAAMLSGVIEYQVIKSLFSETESSAFKTIYIPLLIVIVLEGLKLFLHYVVPSHKRIGDNGTDLVVKNIIKYVLVLFSLICTVIYVSNSLYKPTTVAKTMDNEIQKIEEEYAEKQSNDIAAIQDDAEACIENAEDKVENIRNQLNQLSPVYRPQSAYVNYITEKMRLETELKNAEKDFENKRKTIIAERDSKIKEVKADFSEKMKNDINDANSSFGNVSSGDNPYLSSSISFFASVFLKKGEYSRAVYYLFVVSIALTISVVLELTISFSQGYLATNSEKLQDLFSDNAPIPEAIKVRANRLIKIVVEAGIMLSVYLILQVIAEAEIINSEEIIPVFISYFLSIVLTADRFKLSLNVGEKSDSSNKVHNTFVDVRTYVLPVIVQTLICIVGFLLISVYLGYAISDMIPTTIALSIGSISGQVILQPRSA